MAHVELGRGRERAGGTHRGAVAAVHAGRVGEPDVPFRRDVGVEAATGDRDGERVLPLLATRVDALVTEDAPAVVTDVQVVVDGGGLVHGRPVGTEPLGVGSVLLDPRCDVRRPVSSEVEASSSRTSLRACVVRSVWVCTTMLSSAALVVGRHEYAAAVEPSRRRSGTRSSASASRRSTASARRRLWPGRRRAASRPWER